MRFNRPKWSKKLEFATSRLNFGSYCSLCLGIGALNIDLCDACESLLHRCTHTDRGGLSTQVCLQCGIVLPRCFYAPSRLGGGPAIADSSGSVGMDCCSACRGQIPVFGQIVAPYRYQFPVDQLIQGLKYRNQRQMARVLGSLLARSVRSQAVRSKSISTTLPDCLIPVPLHTARQASRGFNQAQDIARWCARDLQLKSWPGAARRVVDTGSLAGLSRAARQNRILGAFRANEAVMGKRVAIVDDVLTTGSTARELARELYDTGAASVELWVLARTSNDL